MVKRQSSKNAAGPVTKGYKPKVSVAKKAAGYKIAAKARKTRKTIRATNTY